MTLLFNGSFEHGWTDVPVPATGTINQEPEGWTLVWLPPGADLKSADWEGPDDEPRYLTAATIPECVHKHADQLPPDEQPGGPDALILDGEWVFKVFSAVNPYSVALLADVDGLEPERRVVFEVPVQVHQHGDGSPGAAVWRTYLNENIGPWLTFHEDFDDREWLTFGMGGTVNQYGSVSVGIELESRALAGVDFFIDNVRLRYLDPDPPPECRGAPREQYERTYNVIPAHVSEQRATEIFLAAWRTARQTVGGSYDDAGVGDLDNRTATLWDIPAEEMSLFRDFYQQYYPGVTVRFEGTGGSTPPPPPPPPGGEEPQYQLRSNNLIGLHSGFVRDMTFPYIEQSGTTIQKFFSAGDAYQAALAAPGIVSVWRKYVGNEQGRIWEKPTIRESARWYLDQYTAEIEAARSNMGLTLAQFLARPIAIESLNETIPTHNVPVLEDAVEFDVHFCDLAHERYGDAIWTVLLCGAVGNPHESEVPYLLPAAEIAYEWGDFLGYHCYWTARPGQSFLGEHWEYHAGRWTEWDAYFRSQGVYPRYASGEGGICYSPSPDGTSFDPSQGWKACGSIEPYLEDIAFFNALARGWNQAHGNRFAGVTLFGYGNWGWDSFELGDGEVQLLLNWSQSL